MTSETLDPIGQLDAGVPHEFTKITNLIARVDTGAALLSVAYAEEGVAIPRTFVKKPAVSGQRAARPQDRWYSEIMESCFYRLDEIVVAFRMKDRPRIAGASSFESAVRVLSGLTPLESQILALLSRDSEMAIEVLVSQLVLVQKQFEPIALTAFISRDNPDAVSLSAAQDALLEQAGGALSLKEAAGRLGISKQGLHKRIYTGTALGMKKGDEDEILVPSIQLVKDRNGTKVLDGVGTVAKLFKETAAGPWSALQFLIEKDPNLGRTPIEALKDGQVKQVEHAARAYLHADEE